MPSIIGILSHSSTDQQSIARMGACLGQLQTFPCKIENIGRVVLSGANTSQAPVRVGPYLAVIDGCFSNCTELPDAKSDAERFILLFERHGFEGALNRVCGDFLIACYDSDHDILWLGRDRVGIRPCYYADFDSGIAFASHPGPLCRLPGISKEVNPTFVALFAASHYRTFDNDPFATPYKHIRQLPAAHLARIQNGRVYLRRWWQLEDAPEFEEDEPALAERYRHLFFHVVGERLQTAVNPAFTLSGGLDSSSVLATAVQLSGSKQHAFSSVYDDPTFDESNEIADMLESTVDQWHKVRVGQIDVFNTVEKMVASHGEPVATATWLSHYLLCQNVAHAGFDTLFGGLGGDELNAGEYEYFFFHFADIQASGDKATLDQEIAAWAHHHDHPVWRKNHKVARKALQRLVDDSVPGRCLADRQRIERYAGVLRPGCLDLKRFHPAMDGPFQSYLKNRTWQDIYREAAPCCLRAEDRNTKAFGLTNIDPFYDHRLMEFMFRVPGEYKIKNGVTKILLRSAMKNILPEPTRKRIKKTGWNAPAHIWFTGHQAEKVTDLVNSANFKASEYYDRQKVLSLLDEHCSIVQSNAPCDNHMMFFWQLINLEAWLRTLDLISQ